MKPWTPEHSSETQASTCQMIDSKLSLDHLSSLRNFAKDGLDEWFSRLCQLQHVPAPQFAAKVGLRFPYCRLIDVWSSSGPEGPV
uniref:Uncharacterized protein n=1 Tax=Monostroma angicava TaxID=189348 RepID=A0A7U3N9Z8_9CHLO|nr:hypothetical protein [Monostroma angicava]